MGPLASFFSFQIWQVLIWFGKPFPKLSASSVKPLWIPSGFYFSISFFDASKGCQSSITTFICSRKNNKKIKNKNQILLKEEEEEEEPILKEEQHQHGISWWELWSKETGWIVRQPRCEHWKELSFLWREILFGRKLTWKYILIW